MIKEEPTDKSKEETGLQIFLLVGIGVFVLWGGYLVLMLQNSDKWETKGQLGDSFGALNALFSGLAFAGIIITILLQRQELKLQRKELELTRSELKRTAEAQEKAELALREQGLSLQSTSRLNALSGLLQAYQYNFKITQNQIHKKILMK